MGSATSTACETPGGDLRLPASGFRFSVNQLRTLNSYVDTLWEEDQKGRISTELESTVENLVQRIVDGAGQRDPRFRCCHLIALHRGKKMRSRSLEYLVTMDSLPTLNADSDDCQMVDGPDGYGKIRLTGREADKWEEFITPSGYLCRDKVIEHWVELIARCANARGGGGSRVLSAQAHTTAQPYSYCYLERVSGSQPSSDRRLAIVEGAAWVMVRVGAGEAEAKLVLAARVQGCTPHHIARIPLTHPLALLHYTSVQGGYYAVAVAPPASVICGERGSNWQLWNPALEAALDAHCSDVSTVGRVAGALNALVDKMREGIYQGSLRVLSRYAAMCALRRRLDKCAVYSTAAARCCVSAHASHHLLLVLDEIVQLCSRGGTAGYWSLVERDAVSRRGARGVEWEGDAQCVSACLLHLHRVVGEEIPPTPSESLETALFSRWEHLNKEAKAAAGNSYSKRQLRYLWRVCSELVKCKNMISYESHSIFRANLISATAPQAEWLEDVIHMLAVMLDQARDLYVNNFHAKSCAEVDRDLSAYRSKKWNKLKSYYDASSACLIDAARRDPSPRADEPHRRVHTILHWLYKGAKDDKKYLGPVLKPYLDSLFMSSLENSWFLDEEDRCSRELEGLREYCGGVHDGALEPCAALLDAAKRFAWAKAAVDFVDRFRHVEFRLVFPTGDGMAISYPIRLASRRSHSSARTLTLNRRDKEQAKLRLARRCVRAAFHNALLGDRCERPKIGRHESQEILASVKTGNFWRNSTKPDIIPSTQDQDLPRVRRRSRRSRPATSYGFPEISITNTSDQKTMRRKYHTLKSLVYREPVETVKEMRQRPRSAGSTVRQKDALSRPSLLETLDFINSVKNALSVEESGASDVEEIPWSLEEEWLVGQAAPLNLLSARCGAQTLHLAAGDLVTALIDRGKFTILQELCPWLGESSEGALFALHRLARAARSRSSERMASAWKLPEAEGSLEAPQRYKARALDAASGDEAPPPPPPLPRHSSRDRVTPQMSTRYADYLPPNRIQNDPVLLQPKKLPANTYTGIINPIYDVKIPKDKFAVKRSKSLGRSFSLKTSALDIAKYNITLGSKSGKRTNDVVTAITGTTGETGLEHKGSFFQRYTAADVVGDSYRVSRITID